MLPSRFLCVLIQYSTRSSIKSKKKTNGGHRDINSKEWSKIVIINRWYDSLLKGTMKLHQKIPTADKQIKQSGWLPN